MPTIAGDDRRTRTIVVDDRRTRTIAADDRRRCCRIPTIAADRRYRIPAIAADHHRHRILKIVADHRHRIPATVADDRRRIVPETTNVAGGNRVRTILLPIRRYVFADNNGHRTRPDDTARTTAPTTNMTTTRRRWRSPSRIAENTDTAIRKRA